MGKGSVILGGTLTAAFGAAMLGAGAVLGRAGGSGSGGDDYSFLDPLIEIHSLLKRQYVDIPDEQKLQAGAINGMLEVLNDPYTVYVPPTEKAEFNKDLTGEYVGIGASVNIEDDYLIIVSPLEDSPAYRVGLMADDKVVEIDGKSTYKLEVDDCIKLLMGKPGTSVKLTIERKGERLPVEIVRDHIKTKSVKGFHRDEADANKWLYLIDPARKVGYVRLTQFTPACADELYRALDGLGAPNGKLGGLVLDLRGNPGGLLNEAIKIADMFLGGGTIVSTKGRAFPEEIAKAQSPGTLPEFPLVVLVNGASASASEVLSGALAENGRATVVGTRSFGKGLVQSVHGLGATGGELKITEQKYYLPNGKCIQRSDDSADWGVDPTDGYYVPMTDEELIEMFRIRREEEVMKPVGHAKPVQDENWADPAWIVGHLKDKQLGAGLEAIQAKIDTGEWKKTGQAGAPQGAIKGGELVRLRQTRERLLRELARIDKREGTLETGGAEEQANARDFWPDNTELTGGKLDVYDKDGKLVTQLKITGGNLERWLLDADVKKEDMSPAAPSEPGKQ